MKGFNVGWRIPGGAKGTVLRNGLILEKVFLIGHIGLCSDKSSERC